MAFLLPTCKSGWEVDKAIISEDERVVVIRFGRAWEPTCMVNDEALAKIAEKVKKFAVIYLVDNSEVTDFNEMYELTDPCSVMFFVRNKQMMVDLGTGDNNRVNFPISEPSEWIDLLETLYRGGNKGKGLVISPKDYSHHRKRTAGDGEV